MGPFHFYNTLDRLRQMELVTFYGIEKAESIDKKTCCLTFSKLYLENGPKNTPTLA